MAALQRQVTYNLDTWRTVRLRRDMTDEVEDLANQLGLSTGKLIQELVAYALPRVQLRERTVRVYTLGFIDDDDEEAQDA